MESIQNTRYFSLLSATGKDGAATGSSQTGASFQAHLADSSETTTATTLTSTNLLAGISELGIMGWVYAKQQADTDEQARSDALQALGLEESDVDSLTETERKEFEAEVERSKEVLLAQAVKDDALAELQERESVLYRNRPPQLD